LMKRIIKMCLNELTCPRNLIYNKAWHLVTKSQMLQVFKKPKKPILWKRLK
jgi:hypothetical protein